VEYIHVFSSLETYTTETLGPALKLFAVLCSFEIS